MTTITEPTVSLTAAEYLAVDFAAEMLQARADGLHKPLASMIASQAAILAGLRARWHRESVLATDGRLHGPGCRWCMEVAG